MSRASDRAQFGNDTYESFEDFDEPPTQFRVWPDGTVQAVDDGRPHEWMSDDFQLVWAHSEGEAVRAAA